LAPSIGNLHGSYKFFPSGPQFDQSMCVPVVVLNAAELYSLKGLQSRFEGRTPYICLHGTDELPDELFKECIKNGVTKVCEEQTYCKDTLNRPNKINVNSWIRDPYVQALTKALVTKPFPEATEEATEVFAKTTERFLTLFGSAGKA
jgi:fructose-bisphosphate aldolase class II